MRKKKNRTKRKDTFAIIVDGETEVWYFQMLKRNEPDLKVNIEPKIPQKKELSEQYKKVLELKEDYTKVFWIIDLDVIIKESKQTKKGVKSKIQELKEYLINLEKFKNIILIFNNPCLEFWFLLHYKQTTKYFPKCSKVVRQLKIHLSDYEKTQKYFTKQGNDIYLKLKPKLSKAIENTKHTQRKDLNGFEQAICEMNLFFKEMGIFFE